MRVSMLLKMRALSPAALVRHSLALLFVMPYIISNFNIFFLACQSSDAEISSKIRQNSIAIQSNYVGKAFPITYRYVFS